MQGVESLTHFHILWNHLTIFILLLGPSFFFHSQLSPRPSKITSYPLQRLQLTFSPTSILPLSFLRLQPTYNPSFTLYTSPTAFHSVSAVIPQTVFSSLSPPSSCYHSTMHYPSSFQSQSYNTRILLLLPLMHSSLDPPTLPPPRTSPSPLHSLFFLP